MRAELELTLAGFARHQFGIATRAQLVDAHVHASQIERLLRTGRLERLFHAVYRVAGVPHSWKQQLLASCWAGGDRGGVASHRAAAALWSLPGGEDVLEVTNVRWRRGRHDDVIAHET